MGADPGPPEAGALLLAAEAWRALQPGKAGDWEELRAWDELFLAISKARRAGALPGGCLGAAMEAAHLAQAALADAKSDSHYASRHRGWGRSALDKRPYAARLDGARAALASAKAQLLSELEGEGAEHEVMVLAALEAWA